MTVAQTAAAGTAPITEPEVFVRDHTGKGKRIGLHVADELVSNGLADRVSPAGHVRLKLGIGIDKVDSYRGAGASTTTIGRRERQQHHPRCVEWRKPA